MKVSCDRCDCGYGRKKNARHHTPMFPLGVSTRYLSPNFGCVHIVNAPTPILFT
jgi:hypothetical protein